ncbi:MAG: cadherin-like beta sandwich domain-containing protein, partial [Chitinispirillaceae bacterium]|nr:cadherin-like beta sandwich domain-containing protein [Chitinispirillaceae bacterium]
VVTSEDGKTKTTYRVLVNRSSSEIAILSGIEIEGGKLTKEFNSGVLEYEIRVASGVDKIRLKPIAGHIRSTVTVEDNTVPRDSFSRPIVVSYGKSKIPIKVVVTSESKNYSQKYEFYVNRAYVVNISSSVGEDTGKVDPRGVVDVYEGDSLRIRAIVVREGYGFVRWEKVGGCEIGDSLKTETYVKVKGGNGEIKGIFEVKRYNLTLECDTSKGKVVGGGEINHGSPVTIIAEAKEGYHFVGWKIESGIVNIVDSTSEIIDVILRNGDAVIRANFEVNNYKIISKLGENGKQVIIEKEIVEHGDSVKLIAIGNENYTISHWEIISGKCEISNVNKDTVLLVNIKSDIVIMANFKLKYNTFKFSFGGSGDDEGKDVIVTPNGGFLVLGTTTSFGNGKSDIYLSMVSKEGKVLWSNTYGDITNDLGYSIAKTDDNSFVITGVSDGNLLLLKVKEDGTKEWLQAYDFYNYYKDSSYIRITGSSILYTKDNKIVVCGTGHREKGDIISFDNVYVIMFNNKGELLWLNKFEYGSGSSIKSIEENRFVVGGIKTAFAGSIPIISISSSLLFEVDMNGNLVWNDSFNVIKETYDILNTRDNSFILAGKRWDSYYDTHSSCIVKIKNNSQEWIRIFGKEGKKSAATSICGMNDSSFVVTGYVYSPENGTIDVYLWKMSNSGDKLWLKTFDNNEKNDYANSIEYAEDGGFIVVGTTYSESGDKDVLIIKTDPEGNIFQ